MTADVAVSYMDQGDIASASVDYSVSGDVIGADDQRRHARWCRKGTIRDDVRQGAPKARLYRLGAAAED